MAKSDGQTAMLPHTGRPQATLGDDNGVGSHDWTNREKNVYSFFKIYVMDGVA